MCRVGRQSVDEAVPITLGLQAEEPSWPVGVRVVARRAFRTDRPHPLLVFFGDERQDEQTDQRELEVSDDERNHDCLHDLAPWKKGTTPIIIYPKTPQSQV